MPDRNPDPSAIVDDLEAPEEERREVAEEGGPVAGVDLDGLRDDVPEADALDQAREVQTVQGWAPRGIGDEVPEADALDQHREVHLDELDERR